MKTITSLVVFFFMALLTYGQTTLIDFDNDDNWVASSAGALSSYQDDHSYSDGVFSATAVDALRQGNGDQDGFPGALGDYSWRLRNNTDTSWEATIASGGVEDFSVAIRRWDDSPSPDYNLEYSVDNGDSWEFVALIDNASLGESSDWTTFSGTIESDVDDILIRIVPNSSGERIMIDDFEWTSFDDESTSDCGFAGTYDYENSSTLESSIQGFVVDEEGDFITLSFSEGSTESCCDDWFINDAADGSGETIASGSGSIEGDYTSSTGEISFYVTSDGSLTGDTFVYEVICSEPPSCFAPENLEADEVTADSADFSWELAPNESNGYEYVVMPAGLDPLDDASEIVSSGSVASGETTATVSGLDDATPYDLFLRAECEADDFSDYISTSFTTECSVASIDYEEDFTGFTTNLNAGEASICWEEGSGFFDAVDSGGWGSEDFANDTSNPFGDALYINLYSSDGSEDWATSEVIDLGDGSPEYVLSYDVYAMPYYTWSTMDDLGNHIVDVVISTDGGATWDLAESVATYDANNTPDDINNTTETISLDGYSGEIQIGFYAQQNGTSPDVRFYIDNLFVGTPPSCFAPEDLQISEITSNSAEFSWDAIDNPADEDAYTWYVFEEGADPEEDTPVVTGATDDLNVIVADLDAETTYEAYIAADCGDDGESDLSAVVTFTTEPSCFAVEELASSLQSQTSVEISWDAIDNAEDYIWSLYLESDDPEEDDALQSGSTSDLTVLIEDLDAEESYVAFVQTDCGEDDGLSGETSSVSFYTGYCIPSTGNTGDYITEFTTTGALTNVSIIKDEISPDGYDNLSDTEVVTTYPGGEFNILNTFNYNTNNVGIWIDYNDDLEFDESEQVFFESDGSSATKTGTITIPSDLEEGSYRMRVRARYGTTTDVTPCGSQTFADAMDFTLEVGPAPSCLIPENFQVSVISEESAELSWDAVDNPADEDAYTWYVFEEGDDPEEDTPFATGSTDDLSVVVDDLVADTAYEAYISADCGADGESDLSSSISFYTGACQDAGPTSASDTHITSLELTGNDETGIDIPDNCPDQTGVQNESDIEVVLSAGLSYDFNVGIGSCTGTMYSNAGEVWVDFDSSLTFDQEESVASWSSTSIESIQNLTIDIPDDVEPGQYRMRVMQKEFGSLPLDPCESYGYGSVIDFIVNIVPAPSCSVVENVSLDETTTTTATFSWDAVDDAESYDWVIVEEGDDVSDEANHINSGNVSEATVTVDGLEVTTDYDFYVQSNCGEDLVSDFADAVNFTTETPEFASVQLIHNSPDPAAEFVDVYVDGELAVEDFQFRTATEFLPVLAEEEITVDIVPAGDDISNSVFTYIATLVADENYIVVANGALNPAGFDGSVNGDINFGFDIYEGAQTTSANADEVDVLVHHGSLDAPMVSVEETGQGAGMLVTDISYTEFDGYLSVAEDDYELDILDETGEILYRYEANLEELQLANTAITVIASGVLGVDEESEEFFGLWAALPSGGALVELEMIELSSEEFNSENFSYYPNPVESNLQVRAANTIEKVEIFNTLGQRLSTERPNNASPSINMSNLQSGVYLMKVTIEGATESFQVIKK